MKFDFANYLFEICHYSDAMECYPKKYFRESEIHGWRTILFVRFVARRVRVFLYYHRDSTRKVGLGLRVAQPADVLPP